MLGLILQVGSFSFNNLLQQLEDLGFFRYVLPFLLLFAIVYAILHQIKLFEENKGAAILIAVAIGLLALQLDFVPAFFQTLFPKVGVGIALLVIALILAGAFVPTEKNTFNWIMFGVGALIFIIIVILQFSGTEFYGSWWWNQYGALVIVALIVITALILVMFASKKKT